MRDGRSAGRTAERLKYGHRWTKKEAELGAHSDTGLSQRKGSAAWRL